MEAHGYTGVLRTIRRFTRSRAGISAIEFAFILPIMLTLFLGGTEVTQAITVKRKVTMVTRSVGDLVAQAQSMDAVKMQNIFEAAAAVIAPYSNAPMKIVVSSVTIDGNGNAAIDWSRADGDGASPHPQGTPVTLPEGLAVPNTSLIWAETEYDYVPPIGYTITGTIELKDQVYLRPRRGNEIEWES
jgi:Flp pilus assembly protein TadG